MHRTIVAGVAAVLFVLMAVLAGIVTDLHDRGFPQEIGAEAAVGLDFTDAAMSSEEAFQQLGEVSDELGLGLVRVAPDLSGDPSGEIFVVLGGHDHFPEMVSRFGDQPDAQVRDRSYLSNSPATGSYLITGGTAGVDEFSSWLAERQIGATWELDTLGGSLRIVVSESSFATSVLAAVALMAVLALYWLSVKAKGRALRVLAGAPAWRIQYEDLAGFLAPMLVAAIASDAVATVYVGLAHGWVFVPYYATILLTLEAVVIGATMLVALTMSIVSWPSAEMLATREPELASLRRTAGILKAATFVMVIAAVAPAFAAFNTSKEIAAQQARWKSLADQVSLGMAGDPDEFEQLMGPFGDLVVDGQERNAVAFSYVFTPGYWETSQSETGYQNLALTNPRWLELMNIERGDAALGGDSMPRLTSVPLHQVPEGVTRFLDTSMELWVRSHRSADEVLERVSFYEFSGPATIPLASGGGGDLLFLDDVIVVVVPDLHDLSDDFLLSVASTSNLTFAGLAATQELLAEHGLLGKVRAQYVAEEGVLVAQFTAYFAWLQGTALVALIVALILSASIGAFISAMMKARRDFPLRLAGQPWWEILAGRVGEEWLAGGSLAAVAVTIMALRGSQRLLLMSGVAVMGLIASPLAHLVAARWSFKTVSLRRL